MTREDTYQLYRGVGEETTQQALMLKRGPFRLTAGKLYVNKVCISILAYLHWAPMKSLPASLPANRRIHC